MRTNISIEIFYFIYFLSCESAFKLLTHGVFTFQLETYMPDLKLKHHAHYMIMYTI